jgi:hypothetical protein
MAHEDEITRLLDEIAGLKARIAEPEAQRARDARTEGYLPDARQHENGSCHGHVSDQRRALLRKQPIVRKEGPVHRVCPDIDRTAKPCRPLERIEDIDVDSWCKLANCANHRLPYLTVTAV